MVNIFDIQLGNLFLHDGKIFRVDNINRLQEGLDPILTMKDGSSFGGFMIASASELEPMPITTEILEKFFGKPVFNPEFPEYWDEYQVGNTNCYVDDMIEHAGCVMIEFGFNDIKPVKYVHDMQNLIYELTKIKIVCQK